MVALIVCVCAYFYLEVSERSIKLIAESGAGGAKQVSPKCSVANVSMSYKTPRDKQSAIKTGKNPSNFTEIEEKGQKRPG